MDGLLTATVRRADDDSILAYQGIVRDITERKQAEEELRKHRERYFAAGKLSSGIRMATLANGGVGLAPYYDWEDKIPQACKEKVKAAEEAIKADPTITGGK